MRYRATARGFAGRLIEAGEEFEYSGPKGSWMELLEQGKEDEGEDEPLGREGVKAALDGLGVQYNARAGTEALQKLLAASIAKAEQ